MQLTSVLALGLAGTAFASPLYPRDGPAISDASSKVGSAITELDNAVLGITQDQITTQGPQVLQLAATLSQTLNDAAAAVAASPPVADMGEAISDLLVAAPLALQGITVVEDIVQKKEILKAAGYTQQITDSLNSNKAATAAFVNALIANMPSTITGIVSAVGLSDTSSIVNPIFDVGIQQFASDAPPPDLAAAGGAAAAGVGSLTSAFGLSGTGATGTTGSLNLGSLLGSLGGASSTTSSNPLAALLGGASGSSSSGLGALSGLFGGSRTGSSTTTSNPLAALFGGSSSGGLAGLLAGLRPPTATPTA